MIKFVTGDIFESKMDYITIPVNCGGVAGAGLAEQFKKRYPDICKHYVMLCKEKILTPGTCFELWGFERKILLFPTKDFWYNDSKLEYIEKGLDDIPRILEMHPNQSYAFPALGCGFGLLKCDIVKPLMIEKLKDLDCEIEIYEAQPERESNDRKYLSKIATEG